MTDKVEPDIQWADRPVWRSIDCGEGWWPIIERLDKDLREIVPDYRVIQVKEKFGELRYYIEYGEGFTKEQWEAANSRIRTAEYEAARTCEWCGAPGGLNRNRRGWFITLCDACDVKRETRRSARQA